MKKRTGFTLIELLVVVAIIAVLISILLPSLSSAKKMAIDVQCKSNLRQWGVGFTMYMNDYKGSFPIPHPYWLRDNHRYLTSDFAHAWYYVVAPYMGRKGETNPSYIELGCPLARNNTNHDISYAMNDWLYAEYPGTDKVTIRNISRLERPSTNVLLNEFNGRCSTSGSEFMLQTTPLTEMSSVLCAFLFWHGNSGIENGATNFLFCDGRVGSSTFNRMQGWGASDGFWAWDPNAPTHYSN